MDDQDELARAIRSAAVAHEGQRDKAGAAYALHPLRMLFADPDKSRADRAMQAMFGMRKLDVAALREAAEGVPAS